MEIGNKAGEVRAKYDMICPKCGKPAVRREPKPDGTVAYLHLTKHGTLRHFIEPKPEKKRPSQALHAGSSRGGAKRKKAS